MPDFHQPDDDDRRMAEATGAAEGVTGDWAERVPVEELRRRAEAAHVPNAASMSHEELVRALREQRPSSRIDPNSGDRPVT